MRSRMNTSKMVDNQLAVFALMWGGSCVIWWFYVAALLRGCITINTTAEVTFPEGQLERSRTTLSLRIVGARIHGIKTTILLP
jgi:hypothetical protein